MEPQFEPVTESPQQNAGDLNLIAQAFSIADGNTMARGSTAHVLALVKHVRRQEMEIRRLQKLLADREQLRPPEDREPGLEDVRF